jgi:peptidoglycan L-alanyl-D-glutamate endopeptidase CwlK
MSNITNDVNLLHPEVKSLAAQLLTVCAANGIPLKVTETYRSPERQAELYAQGYTQIKTLGMHSYGVAFDVCVNDKSNAYDKELLGAAGAAGKALGLVWGGDAWTTLVDMPHFEYRKWGNITELRKKYPNPDAFRATWKTEEIEDDEMTQEKFNELYKAMIAAKHGDEHNSYAEDAIKWAVSSGIFKGDGAGNYEWRDPLTREELAVILYRQSQNK